jgi:putative membrane protein
MKTNRQFALFLLLTAAVAWLPKIAVSQQPISGDPYATVTDPNIASARPGHDENFVQRGLEDGNAAVVFSKLALTKSSDPDVKALAQKEVDKHLAIGGGLVQDAKALKVQVPKGLTTQYTQQYQELSRLTGDAFDKAYLAALLKLQHDDYEDMMDESKAARAPHLQDETNKDLNTLAQLDDEAEKLSKKLNGK